RVRALEAAAGDPLLCAAGEIGLDAWQGAPPMALQLPVFRAQLRIARSLGLPVSVHARRAVDAVSAEIARLRPPGGVVHAFSGSIEQARRLIGLGMKLGFGGAMLYAGSRRIRAVFSRLPEDAWVLETDAPDMPSPARRAAPDGRTRPSDIALYAREAALLRGATPEDIARQSAANARAAFPGLAALADSA
ncbi:MAG: TatD family hydrolase, partial [Duodenibacillus sp.]|nr:TatD family hydrolase [Duodenibacillus sp.]